MQPKADPALLAIDSSTDRLLIAACGPGGEALHDGPGAACASAEALPRARGLVATVGLVWAELDAVAFGAGPGAFTGLRTACAVAQGLAFGAGCPVLVLDSLALVAEAATDADVCAPLWVAMDARMDEVYAAQYRRIGEDWQVLTPPALYSLAALRDAWRERPPVQVVGSAPTAFADRLPPAGRVVVVDPAQRAAALLRAARTAWHRGRSQDPATALPVYLRDKVALTTAERAAERERATRGAAP